MRRSVSGLAALSLVLVAAPTASASTFEPGPCPQASGPGLESASCGSLVVPENRANPSGPTIRLAVAIIPAQSQTPAPDPVVFMSGGPGSAASPQAQELINSGLNRDRDLIIMDQRGQLFDTPNLDCPEVDPGWTRRSVGLTSYGGRALHLFEQATQKCHDRLVAEGVDLGAYNTTESAADFADLRTALGIAEWNVYGLSYGTDLALTYMRQYPQGVRSVTIDAVTPPDVANLGWPWTSIKEGTGALFRACAAQPRCAKRYPHLRRTWIGLVKELEANPITTQVRSDGKRVKVVLDGAAVLNITPALITTDASTVPAKIAALAGGDASGFAQDRLKFFGATGLAVGMTNSVLCSEWVAYERPSNPRRQGRKAFPNLPGSVLAQPPGLTFQAEACPIWDVAPAPPAIRAPLTASPIPTLVLNGSFDALTGAQWARYAAEKLGNATLVIVPGVGHGALYASTCAQSVEVSFLVNPGAPDLGCVPGMRVRPFKIARR
jgi:pimeloyl-ACP methyl ester carboxylesterase